MSGIPASRPSSLPKTHQPAQDETPQATPTASDHPSHLEKPPLPVRRMDSLARLTHQYTPENRQWQRANARSYRTNTIVPEGRPAGVATAVGHGTHADDPQHYLAIAHNRQDAQQAHDDHERLTQVREVIAGPASAKTTAQALAATSGLPARQTGQPSPTERLTTDLRKLRATHQGKDDSRGGDVVKSMTQAIFAADASSPSVPIKHFTHNHNWVGTEGTVHAESALIAANIPGPIGVSKLSCGDCADYAQEKNRSADLRGSHHLRFKGWRHPDSGAISQVSAGQKQNTQQYADPSSSEVEGSTDESRPATPEITEAPTKKPRKSS